MNPPQNAIPNLTASEAEEARTFRFDYVNQAWIKRGRYVRCGHVAPCPCYGKAHEGELAPEEVTS